VTIAIALMVPASAHAQSAGAEALFREGRTLIKQGKLDAGCDRLEQSEKLESSVGTLLNLGDCREKQGRFATAWAAFRKAESMAKLKGETQRRVAEAKRRADRLEDSLARITVQVGPNSKANGLTIKRDGDEVDPELWGTGIVVDPGNHEIVAEAPNAKPWKTEVSVGKGGKRWVVVPALEPVAEATPATPPPAPPPRVVTTVPPPSTVVVQQRPVIVEHTWNATRGVAVGLGIAGAGALGAGIYFGHRATTLESRSDAICPEKVCGDPEGLQLNHQANNAARDANIFLVAGGAAIAASAVMWFVGGPDSETRMAPSVGADHVGATVSGRF
jgi:serine/threonine-protein kinase